MVLQMLDRLAHQHAALRAGALLTQQRHEGSLACPLILAQPLSSCGLIPGMVERGEGWIVNISILSILAILAGVGYTARLGLLPRTRPIVPGELAVSD